MMAYIACIGPIASGQMGLHGINSNEFDSVVSCELLDSWG